MIINNKKRVVKLRRIFFLGCIVIFVSAVLFFLFDLFGAALICAGVLSLWYLYFHVADYQYIEFRSENAKIILRYYKSIKVGSPKFNEIEFSQNVLRKAIFEDSIFGKKSDLILVIKTKRGIAEYPSLSLSAVAKEDRQKMADSLNDVLIRLK